MNCCAQEMEKLRHQLAAAKAAEGVVSNEPTQVHSSLVPQLLESTVLGPCMALQRLYAPLKVYLQTSLCLDHNTSSD
jgi:hypothetical protein